MKVKTAELSGARLDWAVAKANNYQHVILEDDDKQETLVWVAKAAKAGFDFYQPTKDWTLAGDLLTKYRIKLEPSSPRYEMWFAWHGVTAEGATPQEAICRCVVLSVLGEEIELPPFFE